MASISKHHWEPYLSLRKLLKITEKYCWPGELIRTARKLASEIQSTLVYFGMHTIDSTCFTTVHSMVKI